MTAAHGSTAAPTKKTPLKKIPRQQDTAYPSAMAERIMYLQLKTGYDVDRGPAWIARVRFSKSWRTAHVHGRTLERVREFDANFQDIDTGELFWMSGPKRDRSDGRYSGQQPSVDEDAREDYEAFLAGASLPGREHG